MAKAFFDVTSISGPEDERRIKQSLMILEGVQRVDVNVPAGKVLLTYDEATIELASVTEALTGLGLTVTGTTTA